MTDAEQRVRAAIAAGIAADATDVAAVLDELDTARAEAAERWTAIGALAPAAKEHRLQRQDLERAIRAAIERLREAPGDTAAIHGVAEALARALNRR